MSHKVVMINVTQTLADTLVLSFITSLRNVQTNGTQNNFLLLVGQFSYLNFMLVHAPYLSFYCYIQGAL